MDTVLVYRGRRVTAKDLALVRRLIAEHPGASRRALSAKLCAAWDWRQANGAPRDLLARGLMLQLERAGLIQLPPKRCSPANNVARHARPPRLPEPRWDPPPGPLAALLPVKFQHVRRTPEEPLFDRLIETYHPLGYTRPVGEHVKLLILGRATPLACLALSSAPRHLGPRDRWIGWSATVRRTNLHLIAYNTRFLVLPWANGIPHLASHILGRMARRISADWQAIYCHPIYFLETFVDPARHRATSYRAANWIYLGMTTGRGKADLLNKPNRPPKAIWGYPLVADFRRRLGVVP